ncbi:MAG: hypothetical protein LUD51_00100 [Clostridia bacterium]|nr:hypothetical protein [Clostridia bacterium]
MKRDEDEWDDDYDEDYDDEDYDEDCDDEEDPDDTDDEDEEEYDASEAESAGKGSSVQPGTSELNRIIDGFSDKEVRELLKELAAKNPEVGNIIAIRAGSKADAVDVSNLIKEMNRIKVSYESNGYYDDISAEYAFELTEFIDRYVPELIKAGRFDAANEVIIAVFEKTDDKAEDDYYGYLEDVVEACEKYWREIAQKSVHPFKLEFMERLKELTKEPRTYDYGDGLQDIIEDEFTDDKCLRRRMEWIDRDISEAEAATSELKPERSSLGRYVTDKIELMDEMGCPRSDIEAVIKKYWILPEVRDQYTAGLILENKRIEAIQVLKESRDLDRDSNAAVDSETQKLIELYENLGMTADCKRELLYYLFDMDLRWGRSRLHEFACKLKTLCRPEEWLEYREKMLQSNRFSSIRYEILDDEGLYERLLDALLEDGSLSYVDKYEGKLKPLYPDRLMRFYADYAVRQAPKTSKRDDYARLMPYLKKVASYPGGQSLANEIAMRWKMDYRRKPAFLDELRKAGF